MVFKSKKVFNIIALLILITSLLCIFTACQKVEKESYIGTADNLKYTCSYNSETDSTYIIWSSYIENRSIFNLTSASISFGLYNSGSFVRSTDFVEYDVLISHGETSNIQKSLTVHGNVDSISIVNWTASYSSFWETYKIWMIVFIVLTVLAALIYAIVIFVEYIELEDIFDIISDHLWVLGALLPAIGIGIYSIVKENWVPIAIAGGSLIAFVVLALLIHLVQYIIYSISDYYYEPYYSDVKENEDFSSMTVEELKDYCRVNGIKGYSSLNKQGIIDLILGNNDIENEKDLEVIPVVDNSKKVKKDVITNKITFSDIAGLDNVKEAFREKVVMPFEHPELFEKYGKKSGGGILLYGLPGTGKTMFAEAASNEVDALFIPIKCSDIKSKWYGESEHNIKAIFDKARKSKRSIIFFDEFEAIGAKRNDNSDNGNNDLVPEILAEMQGVGTSNNDSSIIVIAATNKPWSIDSAFLRPGRFDEKIYVPLPDFEARKTLFMLQLSKLPTQDLDYDYLSQITEGFNGADIKEFCEKLKLIVIKESISSNEEKPINMDHVHIVEKTMKSSVVSKDIELLKNFELNY